MRKTKIVATIGPASEKKEVLETLIKEGLNVVRLNFSHGDHEEHLEKIKLIKEMNKELGTNVAILLDTKGPEIRIGEFKDGKATLVKDNCIILTTEVKEGDETEVTITYKNICKDVEIGSHILLNDGMIDLIVTSKTDNSVICQIQNTGTIKSRRGVNIPGVKLSFPALTEQDEKDINFGVKNEVDYIAASFIRKATDVLEIREYLKSLGDNRTKIIAKIENQEGVDNFEEILAEADGIMVARGDMGVELPVTTIPVIQKNIIRKTVGSGKLVITATQMLETMITNPRPTRAEVSDIANAIYDGTSAIMLSGETAVGEYPLECIKMMNDISITVEHSINFWNRFKKRNIDKFTAQDIDYQENNRDVDLHTLKKQMNFSVCSSAMFSNAKAIIAVSENGQTPAIISSFRPACPIFVITSSETAYRQFSLEWGVTAVYVHNTYDFETVLNKGIEELKNKALLEKGDIAILSGGYAKEDNSEKYLSTQALGAVIRI